MPIIQSSIKHFRRRIHFFAMTKCLATSCLVSSMLIPHASADDWTLRLTAADDFLLSDHMRWSERLWAMDHVDQFKLFMSDISIESDGIALMTPFGNTGPVLRVSLSMPIETARCMRNSGAGSIGSLGDDFDQAFLIIRKRW